MLHNQHIKYVTDGGRDGCEISVSSANNGKSKPEGNLPFLTIPYMSE